MQNETNDLDINAISWLGILSRIGGCAILAFGLYIALCSSLLTPYVNLGSDAGRVVGVYEGYQRIAAKTDSQHELVLFWGSSMIREGVDCNLIEAQDKGISAYNLSVSGDIPYRRLVEMPRVQQLKPTRVVIGVSYPEAFETRLPFEDQIGALPSAAYQEMPKAAQALLTPRFREIANRSEMERIWWKRKFLLSAVCWKLGIPDRSNPIPDGFVSNLKDPHVYTKNIKQAELARFLEQRKGFYPPYTAGGELDPAKSSSAKSLTLLIQQLTAQKTQVVLAIMPLHPLLNADVPPERRAQLQKFIRSFASANVQVEDYQDKLGAACFVDLLHLNEQGRLTFSNAIAPYVASHQTMASRIVLSF